MIITLIVAFIIGALFGSGIIWDYQNLKINKIKTVTELRAKLSRLLVQIISLSNEFISVKDSYDKSRDALLNDEMYQLRTRLDVLKNDFEGLEEKLSELENRAPAKIQIEFILP